MSAFCRWLTIEKGVTAIPLSPFYETPPPGQPQCAVLRQERGDAGRGDRAVRTSNCGERLDMDDLNHAITLVQGETRWHDPRATATITAN